MTNGTREDRFREQVLSELEVLYRVARRLTRSTTEAEDLVQDALVRARPAHPRRSAGGAPGHLTAPRRATVRRQGTRGGPRAARPARCRRPNTVERIEERMPPDHEWAPRLATPQDARDAAQLLHDFNVEFDVDTPGVDGLTTRLRLLLADEQTYAVLAGTPADAIALVTLRPNVWYRGPVALLDELYVVPDLRGRGIGSSVMELVLETARHRSVALVEINVDEDDTDAQRFYERHGFAGHEPGSTERAFYFSRELGT